MLLKSLVASHPSLVNAEKIASMHDGDAGGAAIPEEARVRGDHALGAVGRERHGHNGGIEVPAVQVDGDDRGTGRSAITQARGPAYAGSALCVTTASPGKRTRRT